MNESITRASSSSDHIDFALRITDPERAVIGLPYSQDRARYDISIGTDRCSVTHLLIEATDATCALKKFELGSKREFGAHGSSLGPDSHDHVGLNRMFCD